MPAADGHDIQTLIDELTDAWERGDAKAYGARFLPEGTFTNVNGEFYVGREDFDRRHAEIFDREHALASATHGRFAAAV